MVEAQHEIRNLDNGVVVGFTDIQHTSSLLMDIEFSRAGAFYSPPEIRQTAHLMEHMIFMGSASYPTASLFREAISGNGAHVNARTYDDRMAYEITSPLIGGVEALEAFIRGIEQPLFLSKVLETEREIVRDELTGYLNHDNRQLWPAARNASGYPRQITTESLTVIDNITTADLHNHFRRTHSLDTMMAFVTGRLDEATKDRITSVLSNLQLTQQCDVEPIELTLYHPEGPILLERADKSNIYYIMGVTALQNIDKDDAITHGLAQNLLYGYHHSTIKRQARDQGLAYGANGSWRHTDFGFYEFQTYGNVNATSAVKLWKLTITALTQAMEGIDNKQLEAIKLNLTGVRQLAFEYADTVHQRAGFQIRQFGEIVPLAETEQRLMDVSAEELQAAVRKGLTGGIGYAAILANGSTLQNEDILDELKVAQQFFSAE